MASESGRSGESRGQVINNQTQKRAMKKDKRQEIAKLTDEIGESVSMIEDRMSDVDKATDKVFDKLSEIERLLWKMEETTVEDVTKMTKLYRRMRQAQRKGDEALAKIITCQIDLLLGL